MNVFVMWYFGETVLRYLHNLKHISSNILTRFVNNITFVTRQGVISMFLHCDISVG